MVLDFVDPDGSGAQPMALAKRYLYGEAVDQILAQEDVTKTLGDAQRVLWPLVDNLGTVRDLAKQDGTIAVHYIYDSYGNVTSRRHLQDPLPVHRPRVGRGRRISNTTAPAGTMPR